MKYSTRELLLKYLHKINFKLQNLNYDFSKNGEKRVLECLSKHDVKSIFDVGANIGEYSVILNKYFPDSTIHAFELSEDTYITLAQNIKGLKNIICNNVGLSDVHQKIKMKYYGKNNTLNSLIDFDANEKFEMKDAYVITGDEYMMEKNIEVIDFLKIDVEGAEHLVLKGFENSIKRGKIKVIQFEYGYINIITKFLLYDFYKYFNSLGYVVGKIYPEYVDFKNYEYRDENFIGPNYVAVKYSLKHIISDLNGKN